MYLSHLFFGGKTIIELIRALILGFTVGISAAIIPGPMMFATIGASVKNGWKVGPLVFIGHAFVELTIFLIILVGITSFLENTVLSYIAIIGGLVMLLFGLVMIKNAKKTSSMHLSASANGLNSPSAPANKIYSASSPFSGSVSTGILTSALNPFLVIWWLTAGSAIILQEYSGGIISVLAFIAGHWLADLVFLVAVSLSFSRGTEIISQRNHEILVYICGVFMMLFGIWFLLNNGSISTKI